jgi:aldose 1-epimerase
MKSFAVALTGAALLFALPAEAKIDQAPWGETADHQKVDIYTLTNAHGMSARITNYGAYLVSLEVPDRNNKMADVVLGYDTLDGYKTGTTYGAVIGRFANRIGGAQFTVEGKTYHLKANAGPNNIHGGPVGFSYHVYSATPMNVPSPSLVLHMESP